MTDTVSNPSAAPAVDAIEASFDILARQDEQATAITEIRSDVDVVKADVADVKSRVAAITRAASRPALVTADQARSAEVKGFVDGYLRHGRVSELKSLNISAPADGGYAVPREIDAMIARQLASISPIRAIANVVQTGSAGYRKLVATGAVASGWVSDAAARPETDTPVFAEIAPPSGELYANPAASQSMLDDAAFDVEAWLADEIAREFARAEGAAFINGTGVNQPMGFLSVTATPQADDVRDFGKLQFVTSGEAAGFDVDEPENALVDLVHALRPAHRQGAAFVMNSATLARIRKFKTADGAFMWTPSLAEGQPDRLLGYPVIEAEDMPDVEPGSTPVAFGNFRNGYLIAERTATSILRDPFTNKPFVHFYATKRVGGQIADSDAIKLLKIAA